VPEENDFAMVNGDLVISKAFTWSGRRCDRRRGVAPLA